MTKSNQDSVLPAYAYGSGGRARGGARVGTVAMALAAVGLAAVLLALHGHLGRGVFTGLGQAEVVPEPFYHSVMTHEDVCVGGVSHSGYVGLEGDTEDAPKRSFFWCVWLACDVVVPCPDTALKVFPSSAQP